MIPVLSPIVVDDSTLLRPWTAADATDYTALVRANYETLHPVAQWASEAFAEADYLAWLAEQDDNLALKMAVVQWGLPAGSIVVESREGGVAELSFWLAVELRGQGVVPRCVRALEHLLRDAGVSLLEIHAQETNVSSAAVAAKAGFRLVREYSDRPSRPGVRHVVFAKRLD